MVAPFVFISIGVLFFLLGTQVGELILHEVYEYAKFRVARDYVYSHNESDPLWEDQYITYLWYKKSHHLRDH